MSTAASTPPERSAKSNSRGRTAPLVVHIGHEELVIRHRYETASIVNDILIAVWFIAGSIMFFYSDLMTAGTWCFLLGSVELLIRPGLRLSRQIHIGRLRSANSPSAESSLDF